MSMRRNTETYLPQDTEELVILEALRLTPREREIILDVLRRDEALRKRNQQRVMRLKAELQALRRRGALRPSSEFGGGSGGGGAVTISAERTCARCRVELGRIINRGAICRTCRQRVCKACREYSFKTTDWVCCVCHKHMEIQAATGEWIHEFKRRSSLRRENSRTSGLNLQPAADIIKRTIRRSWTISNPQPRWSYLRSSAEFRPYSSLPRGQDVESYPSLLPHQTSTTSCQQQPQQQQQQQQQQKQQLQRPSSKSPEPLLSPVSPSTTRREPSPQPPLSPRLLSPRMHTQELRRSYTDGQSIYVSPLLRQKSPKREPSPEFVRPAIEIDDNVLKPKSPCGRISPRRSPLQDRRLFPEALNISPSKIEHPPRRISPLAKAYSEEPKIPHSPQQARPQLRAFSSQGSQDLPKPPSQIPPPKFFSELAKKVAAENSNRETTIPPSSSPKLPHSPSKIPSPRKKNYPRNEFFDSIDSSPKFAPRKVSGSATSFEEVVKAVMERKASEDKSASFEKRVSFESELTESRKSSLYAKDDIKIKSESSLLKSKTSGKDIDPEKLKSYSTDDKRYQPLLNLKSDAELTSVAATCKNLEDLSTMGLSTEEGDVEVLSGTLFRKVTVKRRRQEMKKVSAIDNGISNPHRSRHNHCRSNFYEEHQNNRINASGAVDHLADLLTTIELDSISAGRILLPDGEDYKLVFISSSDSSSSSKEEDEEEDGDTDDADDEDFNEDCGSNLSSPKLSSRILLDECDWDYFDTSFANPMSTTSSTTTTNSSNRSILRDWPCWSNRNSPFSSPQVYRRRYSSSNLTPSPVFGSPRHYRKSRGESDTGTDEDSISTRIDIGSSSESSNSGLNSLPRRQKLKISENVVQCCTTTEKINSCENCGTAVPEKQYIPIPVPVPIPVPIPTLWNPQDSILLYNPDTIDSALQLRLQGLQDKNTTTANATFVGNTFNNINSGIWLWPPYYNGNSIISEALSGTASSMTGGVISSQTMISNNNSDSDNITTTGKNNSPIETCDAATFINNTTSSVASEDISKTCDSEKSFLDEKLFIVEDTTQGVVEQNVCDNNQSENLLESCEDMKRTEEKKSPESVVPEPALNGYLNSENLYISSASSIDSTTGESEIDESNSSEENGSNGDVRRLRRRVAIKRTYNVTEGDKRFSDDALPPSSNISSASDSPSADDDSSSSAPSDADETEKQNDMNKDSALVRPPSNYSSSSSSSSPGDDDTDSDDTGTVADRKTKRFSHVFIVNSKNDSDSSSQTSDSSTKSKRRRKRNNNSTSSENNKFSTSSDNDTDMDGDCLCILETIRNFSDDEKSDFRKVSNEIILSDVSSDNKNCVLKQFKILSENDSFEKSQIGESMLEPSSTNSEQNSEKSDRDTNGHVSTDKVPTNSENNNFGNIKSEIEVTADESTEQQNRSIPTIEQNESKEIDVAEQNVKNDINVKLSEILNPPTTVNETTTKPSTTTPLKHRKNKNNQNSKSNKDKKCNNINDKAMISNETRVIAEFDLTKSTDQQQLSTTELGNQCNNNNGSDGGSCNNNNNNNNEWHIFDDDEEHSTSVPPIIAAINTTTVSRGESGGSTNTSSSRTEPLLCSTGAPCCGISGNSIASSSAPQSNTTALSSSTTNVVTSVGEQQQTSNQRYVVTAPAKYTSLVMITQETGGVPSNYHNVAPPQAQVSVITSETTTLIDETVENDSSSVIVRHTNWENEKQHLSEHHDNSGGSIIDETADSHSSIEPNSLTGYFTLTLENANNNNSPTRRRRPIVVQRQDLEETNEEFPQVNEQDFISDEQSIKVRDKVNDVTVVTGADTLSAVICLEEGLADDDSWVEDVSHDEDEFASTTPTTTATEDSSSGGEEVTLSTSLCSPSDREEELRGYHRSAIDFTLHTIVEESCEESEVESTKAQNNKKQRPTSTTELEKYFFYGLAGGENNQNDIPGDTFSETSSIYSESVDSLTGETDNQNEAQDNEQDPADLASSRLEKYFLSGFMGFTPERRDSDGSGSVGSDSEGHPSPEQRRKRLVRARGTGRSHSSSLDNLLANPELSSNNEQSQNQLESQIDSEGSSTETDTYEDPFNSEKLDGQFDTVKRKKCKKSRGNTNTNVNNQSPVEDKILDPSTEINNEEDSLTEEEDDAGNKTPQPEFLLPTDLSTNRKDQSRDSGFVGSCDDLVKEQRNTNSSNNENNSSNNELPTQTTTSNKNIINETKATNLDSNVIEEIPKKVEQIKPFATASTPPATSLTRKDSFNNWSSDEETNLMMSKMRQFFKTMVANSQKTNQIPSKPTTPILGGDVTKNIQSPKVKHRGQKPPQLVYFENELTRLMKTVPGIRDDQVREIVEYLSSEDTWSDSYDSSDYTSSDLEGATAGTQKSALQQEISDSCQQIINKFDTSKNPSITPTAEDEEGDEGDGGIIDESAHSLNRETAFVYQKLVASFSKMATGDNSILTDQANPSIHNNSPPLIAKVMHHIGSRLVALMHEVSSGESHASNSPKIVHRYHHHRKLQHKISSGSTTTTEDDDSTSDSNLPDNRNIEDTVSTTYPSLLPRSRSHDLLLSEARALHQSSSGVSDNAEERGEASDYERFSWRGSFESALMATHDSRTKLTLLGGENSASASALALAAKRRSAGDLLFSHKSLSREQLDRVRSCGSIGGCSDEKSWVTPTKPSRRRRSSVPDATRGDEHDEDDEEDSNDTDSNRSTLPRSLQMIGTASSNSLPRLPVGHQTMHHFLQHNNNVKSARYRPPGFNTFRNNTNSSTSSSNNTNTLSVGPKRAVSAPGLAVSATRRDTRGRRIVSTPGDDISLTESNTSPILVRPRSGSSKSATPSPAPSNRSRGHSSVSSAEWPPSAEDDIDRLVALHQSKSGLSTLGVRSDSLASVYSGAGEGRYGHVPVRGQVEFGLQYNYKAGALEIYVKQCRDLAAVDAKRNRSDPYVKVYLLPDKSKSGKRKTKVKKHTLNPVFDETLKFHMTLNSLETRTLWLTVWHSDMFGRNDFLGEVMMSLENKVFDDPTPQWYTLQERTEPFDDLLSYKGDIIVGLKFVPPDMTITKKGKRSKGALHVLIKEAKNLTAVKANGSSDPFCKAYLLPDKGRSTKQKTPVLRRTCNPVWNCTFVYDDVSLQELSERSLELTVWDHDRLASNEFLGGVRFSLGTGKNYGKSVDWMDSAGKELQLWQDMLNRPNFWVEGSVPLRASLENRAA